VRASSPTKLSKASSPVKPMRIDVPEPLPAHPTVRPQSLKPPRSRSPAKAVPKKTPAPKLTGQTKIGDFFVGDGKKTRTKSLPPNNQQPTQKQTKITDFVKASKRGKSVPPVLAIEDKQRSLSPRRNKKARLSIEDGSVKVIPLRNKSPPKAPIKMGDKVRVVLANREKSPERKRTKIAPLLEIEDVKPESKPNKAEKKPVIKVTGKKMKKVPAPSHANIPLIKQILMKAIEDGVLSKTTSTQVKELMKATTSAKGLRKKEINGTLKSLYAKNYNMIKAS
jgi:hypothetical protein